LSTLPQFISDALRTPRERAFAERLGAPEWTYTSSTRMHERATNIARALAAAGIGSGDRVGLLANNCVDWLAADFGIHYANCVMVPIFSTIAFDQVDYIFKDSAAKLVFVETEADIERFRAACPNVPRLVALRGTGPNSLAALEAVGAAASGVAAQAFAHPAGDDDLAVLIYTSGTTGNPKGVMLTHRNLVFNATTAAEFVLEGVINHGDPVMTVLPYAHIYEHTDLLCCLYAQAEIYVTAPDYLLEDLKSARPKVMALVPRIFERVLAGIVGKARAEGGVKAKLVPWALSVGREYMIAKQSGKNVAPALSLQFAVAQKLVLSKVRPTIGLDRVDFFSSGSAPLHRDIALTFAAIGVPICEGYGLTETSPVVTANRLQHIRYGSVGQVLPGLEVKLASDGEILVKGPSVMKGYYNLPSEHPFDDDGFFRTGDIGTFDADGFLFITDRKKELIKTSAGKYVAPGRVESALKRSIYVGQCFVIGDGRPYPVALVCPNWDLIRKEFGIPADVSTQTISARADIKEFMLKEIIEKSSDLASFESVRKIALLPRDLTIEDGELSPTLKVKRRVVEKKFADIIESAYTNGTVTAK
jgi:long-chain acyl-CoA synthetase